MYTKRDIYIWRWQIAAKYDFYAPYNLRYLSTLNVTSCPEPATNWHIISDDGNAGNEELKIKYYELNKQIKKLVVYISLKSMYNSVIITPLFYSGY